MITFTKILEYELRPADRNIYEYVEQVASQQIDPPSLRKGELILSGKMVLHSPLRRAVECLHKISTTTYMAMDELKEIPFDLQKMCTEDEWSKKGSALVRNKFKEMFINDQLLVPRKQIFDEIRSVIKMCKEHAGEDVSVVSHSFRMKLIEAYIITKGEIEKKPELIHEFIKDNQKTYSFGEGFQLDKLY